MKESMHMVMDIGYKNFKKEVVESDMPVIADFWASWCSPCLILAPVFKELSEDPAFKGKLKFVKINTEEEPELTQKHFISGIPCLVIMDKGKETGRIVGFASKEQLKRKIEAELKK
ncbi:MAG: thioredoxin [Nanoarchaeota archaeon]